MKNFYKMDLKIDGDQDAGSQSKDKLFPRLI